MLAISIPFSNAPTSHRKNRRRKMSSSENRPWQTLISTAQTRTNHLLRTTNRALTTLSARTKRLKTAIETHPTLTARVSPEYIRGGLECLTITATLSLLVYATYKGFRVYRTVADLPPSLLRNRSLRGTVLSVRDGDGLRIVHRPFLRRLLSRPPAPKARGISKSTINVRLAAVDAPECSVPTLGVKAAQPYGPRAREWLRSYLVGREVSVRMHAVDQYRRVVATVTRHHANPVFRFLGLGRRNVSLELTKAGYATLYEGAGAQYGGEFMKAVYKAAEDVARRSGMGMWADRKGYVSPGEFKKAARAGEIALRELEKRVAGGVVPKKVAGIARTAVAKNGGTAIMKDSVEMPLATKEEHDSLLVSLYKFVAFSYQFLKRYR